MVVCRRFELTAANRGEFVIDEEAPEFGCGLCIGADGGDEEVLKCGFVNAVEWEMGELGGGVKGVGWCVSGFGVGAVVGTVALVGSA